MLTYFKAPVRTLLLAAALAFAAQTADARSPAPDQPQATTRATARTRGDAAPANSDGTSIDGVLLIVGIVGVVIVLAWVCSRFGDSR